MFVPLSAVAGDATAALVPLQELPPVLNGPVGTLLAALVVVALVLFVGRFVMDVAWRLVKIAIVVVGVAWLALTILPML